MSNKVLEVKKMKISFRTNNGTVKAVRDISFDLYKGETLAIVGESGSGKSVTSKAILGILAGNSIIDGGEILYDGKDLLKVPESEMHKIRGDKIAMVFQDPLSSLNPIVKIGKQITEAMILKNRAARAMGRKEFNTKLSVLKDYMNLATNNEQTEVIEQLVTTFDKFNINALKLENDYNESFSKAEELISEIDDIIFLTEKNQKIDVKDKINSLIKLLKQINNPYFVNNYSSELIKIHNELIAQIAVNKQKITVKNKIKNAVKGEVVKSNAALETVEVLRHAREVFASMVSAEKPNFFRIGYYLFKNPNADLTSKPIGEVNEMALEFLQKDFMLEFIKYEKQAIMLSYNTALENKKAVLENLASLKQYFSTTAFEKKEAVAKAKETAELVEKSFDLLEISKDSVAYTFESSLFAAIKKYFETIINNEKEEARYAKQKAKHDALIAKGKKVDWKIVPKKIIDLEDQLASIISVIERLERKYTSEVNRDSEINFDQKSVDLIDFFKEKASQVVYKLTNAMAKEKAIKLMDEVGIPESRLRFNQYPFEFSGGMRQRIVIAIALSANPDILICDEPTTALDVTIQSQILELINKLKAERNLSIIFITHDLGVVANMADRIAVMYAGKIVEYGTSEDIFYSPAHPYTWALLSSMPDLDTSEKLEVIPGTPPNMIYPPQGDAFAERNKYALKIDFEKQPPLFKISDTHYAATWLLHPNAPKVEIPKNISDRIKRMKEAGGN